MNVTGDRVRIWLRVANVRVQWKTLPNVITAISIAMLPFALGRVVPVEYVLLLLIPDVLLGLAALVIFRGSPDVVVTRLGKWRTAVLFVGWMVMLVGMAVGIADGPALAVSVLVGGGFATALLGLIGHYAAAGQYALAMAKSRVARPARVA